MVQRNFFTKIQSRPFIETAFCWALWLHNRAIQSKAWITMKIRIHILINRLLYRTFDCLRPLEYVELPNPVYLLIHIIYLNVQRWSIRYTVSTIYTHSWLGGHTPLFYVNLQPTPHLFLGFPLSKYPSFPTCHRSIRKTKVLNNSFNWFLYNFYPQRILSFEECLQRW